MNHRNGCRHILRHLYVWLLYAIVAAAQAGDLELGMQALDMGYTRRAIELWRPLADGGNAEAQFGLGVIYNDAMGVPQDYVEAVYWFLRAAEQGYPPAQFNLGNAYKNGDGMAQDARMAVIWWRKAAEQGFGPAQYNLGTAYLEGTGVARDPNAALEWYRRAAANGHPYAQLYLDEHAPQDRSAPPATGKPAAAGAPAIGTAVDTANPEPVVSPRETASPIASMTQEETLASSAGASRDLTDTSSSTLEQTRRETSETVPETAAPSCGDWLKQGPDNGYTIQLMASRELRSSTDFVQQHGLADSVICSYSVKNRIWHALLYGQYPNAGGARAALAALPEDVRAGGAYLRRLKEIRKAIEASP